MSPRTMPSMPKKHGMEEHLSEMHDALYQLGDQIRAPMGGTGSHLLPKSVRPEKPGAKAAKKHIAKLHRAFRQLKKEK